MNEEKKEYIKYQINQLENRHGDKETIDQLKDLLNRLEYYDEKKDKARNFRNQIRYEEPQMQKRVDEKHINKKEKKSSNKPRIKKWAILTGIYISARSNRI